MHGWGNPMAERLGEALLDLRTNDAGFTAGVTQAEARANKLGSTLDKTKGSSAQLATEMTRTGQSAAQMSAGFEQAGQRVVASAGAQRAGMQQLSFQLNDIATMFALGARPMQIFASQSGQVIQSIQMMAGGTSRVAAFLGGPWGLAITSAAVVLTPFIGKLFEAEQALKDVEFASDKMGDAQGILGSVIDATTGKINTQSQALLALARAQAAAGRVGALARRAEAGNQLTDIRRGQVEVQPGVMGFRLGRRREGTEDVVTDFTNGRIGASFAVGSLESRLRAGMITDEAFLAASQAITNFEVEGANVRVFEDLQSALNGDRAAARGIMGPQRSSQRRDRAGPRGPDQGQIDARAESQLVQITQNILRARLQMATSAEERAELAERGVEWDRRTQLAQIEADQQLSTAQKEELAAATNRLADTELEAIAFAKRIELAADAQALADLRADGELEALQNSQQLADTEAERKAIALRLLDAEERLERLRLSTIISAAETDEAERARAQQALANLDANSAGRRAAVGRQNETEVERYMRGLNQTPGQINEALQGISIDALETLNDGIADAIMGAENLGDVFDNVADQIIAALLRIAIQQAIIKPLAGALFGGESGGGGLFGGLFAGLFAKGGTIPTGQFGIVGEAGPELAFAGPGGLGILSNGNSKAALGAGGTNISMPITIDATGADAAAIARLNARLEQMQAELPGRIVTTVQDARDRRILNLGGAR